MLRRRRVEVEECVEAPTELREELSEAPRAVHADDFGRAVDADSMAVARYKREEEARIAEEKRLKE